MQGGKESQHPYALIICFTTPNPEWSHFTCKYSYILSGQAARKIAGFPFSPLFHAVSQCGSHWGFRFLYHLSSRVCFGDWSFNGPNWNSMLGNTVMCAEHGTFTVSQNPTCVREMATVSVCATGAGGCDREWDRQRDKDHQSVSPPALSCPARLQWMSTLSQRN